MRDIFILNFTHHLVLALNYKQHITLPVKIITACNLLAEFYVKTVYLNLFGWRGGSVKFMKHFKGGASYNIWERLL
jgi:hypothetical protein